MTVVRLAILEKYVILKTVNKQYIHIYIFPQSEY